jgi:signal peptidase I
LEHFHTEAFPDPFETVDERSGFMRFLVDVFETLILSLILFLAINAISARIRVDGFSMEPTLHTGEFVIVNKVSYKIGDPERGDIIVFHYPRNPEQEYIKRVIGLPGDEVEIRNGEVLVNGQILDEPYIKASPAYPGTWLVPENSLFVLGDNRNNSSDSHNWGEVPLDLVIGKAIFIYWPPTEWGVIDKPFDAFAAPE